MIAAWKQVRALDAKAPPPTVSISDDEVERIALSALELLPAEVRAKLANVPILIDDVPSEGLVEDGTDPRLLGLFSGAPMADGIANAATGWPVWMALNQSDVSYVWTYLAALVTIGLAGLSTWIVAVVVARPAHEATIVALSSLRTALRGTGKVAALWW